MKRINFRQFTLIFLLGCSLSVISCGPPQHDEGLGLSSLSYTMGDQELAVKAMDVLESRCQHCHVPVVASGGPVDIMDVDYLVSAGYLIPGHSRNSPIVKTIVDGTMPEDMNETGPLSENQKLVISNWIDSMQRF